MIWWFCPTSPDVTCSWLSSLIMVIKLINDQSFGQKKNAFAVKDTIELMNKSPQNFERLVLVCIDSYDSEKRRILQHFSRSTRFAFLCTAQISNFQQKLREFFLHFFENFHENFKIL